MPAVDFTEEGVVFKTNGKTQVLALWADVLNVTPGEDGASVLIHAYPIKKADAKHPTKQMRVPKLIRVPHEDLLPAHQTDEGVVEAWIERARHMCGRSAENRPRSFLVLVNPVSGAGKGEKIWAKVAPVFAAAGIDTSVVFTTHAGHAREYVRTMDLNTHEHVAVVSGDGSVHEVLNGLMDRKDYADALKHVKFGLVPAGSGNGLSKSTTRVSGLGLSPLNVAFLMCKGVHRPMDVFSCLQRLEDNSLQTTFGFLSLGWAVVSDIDFESEKWRSCCGGNRFLMTAVARLCCLRKYEAKLEYVRVPTTAEEGDESTRCTVRDSCPTCLAADAKQVEASMTALQAYRANPAPCSAEEAVGWEGAEETWEEMSDDFKVLWALNVPDASYEFFAAPRAHLADGAIDLVVFRGNMNCCNLLCAFPSLFDGSHTQHKRCEYVKVSALRLTPPPVGKGQHECKLCIDGEEIPYRPVEIRVFQGLLNVYGA